MVHREDWWTSSNIQWIAYNIHDIEVTVFLVVNTVTIYFIINTVSKVMNTLSNEYGEYHNEYNVYRNKDENSTSVTRIVTTYMSANNRGIHTGDTKCPWKPHCIEGETVNVNFENWMLAVTSLWSWEKYASRCGFKIMISENVPKQIFVVDGWSW